jgi:hypothetical protein
MYYIEVGKGWLQYPHTQTSYHNFMGLHRHGSSLFQGRVGNWMVNKDYYAYGNYRHWENFVPFSPGQGKLSAMGGQAFATKHYGSSTQFPETAWNCYLKTGDYDFIEGVYTNIYKPLFWNGILASHEKKIDAVKSLYKMAVLTGDSDPDHWLGMASQGQDRLNDLDSGWERNNNFPYIYKANSEPNPLSITSFFYMQGSDFPHLWATQMTDYWGANEEYGFFGDPALGHVPVLTTALANWEEISTNFAVTADGSYQAITGMFEHQTGLNAVKILLGHLKGYNYSQDLDMPTAPECLNISMQFNNNMFSNFNAGKILLILEGLCGMDYSVVDSTFTISDTMPTEWSYMDVMVPIGDGDQADWVDVQVERAPSGGDIVKTYSVEDCPLDTLKINAFLEEREIASATNTNYTYDHDDYHGYALYDAFSGSSDPTVTLTLSDTSPPWPYTSLWKKAPAANGTSSIKMEAEWSIDKDGVQYYFECTTDSQFNSAWRDSQKYTANGLSSNTTYTFRVKTRDLSAGNFESSYSETKSAKTD